MRAILKNIVGHTYKPLLSRYLATTRLYRFGKVELEIPPEVFHPKFFFSTRFLLGAISSLPLAGKKFLELGAGSGLIAMTVANKGAIVTATDINPTAIRYLHANSFRNNVSIHILHSDLFKRIPSQLFDVIAINPPFYKKNPFSEIDFAWYCGEHMEYFNDLFDQMGFYMHSDTTVFMVCCEGCDIAMIEKIAGEKGFAIHCKETKTYLLEKHFIFQIQKKS